MTRILLLLIASMTLSFGFSQELEEEIEFKYIKAKYLLDTERYEDAIKAFTDIIKEDNSYKDVLEMRAASKYAMAAYKGTVNDIVESIQVYGVTPNAATLLGKAHYRMGKTKQAENSLRMAANSDVEDAQVYEFLADIYYSDEKLLKACEYWQIGASKGSSKAKMNARKNCGSVSQAEPKTDPPAVDKKTDAERKRDDVVERPSEEDVLNGKKSDEDVQNSDNASTEENNSEVEEKLPEEDNTPNEIKIDDELMLVVRGQGLGKRKILEQPNILIIADESGVVGIDVCVNSRGKVEMAEFNPKLSTIANKGLVSLAIRKSKEFWFEKNDYKEQCGVILYKIIVD